MHSKRERSLTARVVLGATLSGAFAGALAAITAIVAVDRMIAERADRRLSGAAEVLAGEIDEGFEEGEWEPLAEILADENGELRSSGIRLGVYSGTHRIGGEPMVPFVAAGSCATHGDVGERVRACGRSYGDWVLVAATQADDAGLPLIYLIAGLGALLVGAGSSAWAGRAVTRWALRPLTQLTAAVRELHPGRAGRLDAPSECEEVELIRAALLELLERTSFEHEQAQRLAADAAHELRTPLTTICGELELLVEASGTASEREALVRATRRARQLAQLVEQLLVLASPPEAARQATETVALAEIIEDVRADLPESARVRTRVSLQSEGCVRGDATLLRSLVSNAIDNALKFSEPAAVEVELADARSESGDPEVQLEVRDRGPGIPADLRKRVFEPFFRLRPDASPGHGLGLSLISHIARSHRARAEFVEPRTTSDMAGACLRLRFPAWTAQPTDHSLS
jgi:signal transduction histidine kinase